MPDREKVVNALANCVTVFGMRDCSECPYKDSDDCENNLMFDALALLKKLEVKHGEWITIWREDDPDTSTHARCSVCNRVSDRPAGEYCRWCGAKMDLEGR